VSMSAARLVPADFASFFEAIWGFAPFPLSFGME
jgi:hypothetical protein